MYKKKMFQKLVQKIKGDKPPLMERDLAQVLTEDPLLYEHLSYHLRATPKLARIAVLGQGSLAANVPRNVVPEKILDHWVEWSIMFANTTDLYVLWAMNEGERCHLKLLLHGHPNANEIVCRAPYKKPKEAADALLWPAQRAQCLYAVTPHEQKARDTCVSILQEVSTLLLRP